MLAVGSARLRTEGCGEDSRFFFFVQALLAVTLQGAHLLTSPRLLRAPVQVPPVWASCGAALSHGCLVSAPWTRPRCSAAVFIAVSPNTHQILNGV